MELAELFGWLASIFTTIIFLPQLIKAVTTRLTHDISMWMLILSLLGNGFWFAHANLTGNTPLLVCATLIILITLLLMGFKFVNDRRGELSG